MDTGALGRIYEDGEIIVREGDAGDCMFVIQEGEVEILSDEDGKQILIATRQAGDFIGEMAIFDRDVRSATVRAKGQVRILTVDKKNFMSRIHEDPSLAFRIVETMSHRLRELQAAYTKLLEEK
jgi:CRP/FNR family transcriptional regulator